MIEPLARRLWRFWRGRQHVFDLDDLRQAGMLGTIDAWGAYGPHVRLPFLGYARRAAWTAMVHLASTGCALSGRDVRNGRFVHAAAALDRDVIEQRPLQADAPDVSQYLAVLSTPARELVESHCGIGRPALPFDELARVMDQPYHTVYHRYRRALARMRKAAISANDIAPTGEAEAISRNGRNLVIVHARFNDNKMP